MRKSTRGGRTQTKSRGRTPTRRSAPSKTRGRAKPIARRRTTARPTTRRTTSKAVAAPKTEKAGCAPLTVVPEGSPVIKGRTLKWFIVLSPKLHEPGQLKIDVFPETAFRAPVKTIDYNRNQMVVAFDTEILRDAPLDYAVLTATIGSASACGIVLFRQVAFQ